MAGRLDDQIRCSFCNKPQSQVRKLIAGPAGSYICDERVEVCTEILEEELEYEEGKVLSMILHCTNRKKSKHFLMNM